VLPEAKEAMIVEEPDDGYVRPAQSAKHSLVSESVHVDEIGRQLMCLRFEVVNRAGRCEAPEIVGIQSSGVLV
jgi:hypothetical protein